MTNVTYGPRKVTQQRGGNRQPTKAEVTATHNKRKRGVETAPEVSPPTPIREKLGGRQAELAKRHPEITKLVPGSAAHVYAIRILKHYPEYAISGRGQHERAMRAASNQARKGLPADLKRRPNALKFGYHCADRALKQAYRDINAQKSRAA